MTDRNLDQLLDAWMDLGPTVAPSRVVDAVRLETRSTRQSASLRGWPPRRFPVMNTTAKILAGSAAVIAAVVLGYAYLVAPNVGGPGPEAPVPTATATPVRLNELPTGSLPAGRYEIDEIFPIRVTFALPEGFTHGRGDGDVVGIHWDRSGSPRGIEFQRVTNVFADPCRTSEGPMDPPIGPTVDELVDAMRALPGFEAGAVSDVTIGGLPAKAFDLTNSIDDATCDGGMIAGWWLASGTSSPIGPEQRQRIYVMDVGGERLVIMTYHFVESDAAEAVTMLQEIVDSIEFP